MADDVWGSTGGRGGRQREWLYRQNGRLYGPLGTNAVIDKIRSGELPGTLTVAPDGSDDFRPLDSFEDFRDEVPKALAQLELKRQRDATKKRAEFKQRLTIAVVLIFALGLGGGVYAGTQWYRAEQQRKAIARAEEERLDAERKAKQAKEAKERKEAEAKAEAERQSQADKKAVANADPEIDLELLPLVSVKKKAKPVPGSKRPPVEEGTEGCQLDQGELVASFRSSFPQLKMCIKEQQKRGESLPETVNLSFTIANAGNVAAFDMADSGIKSGPFFDCMKKAVTAVRYKKFPGERCNVDYPITIGKKK